MLLNCAQRQSLRQTVMASVYLQVNSQLLMDGLALGDVTYMTPGEIQMMAEAQVQPTGADRVWEYWVRRAGCEAL